jgi:hypothetical protein
MDGVPAGAHVHPAPDAEPTSRLRHGQLLRWAAGSPSRDEASCSPATSTVVTARPCGYTVESTVSAATSAMRVGCLLVAGFEAVTMKPGAPATPDIWRTTDRSVSSPRHAPPRDVPRSQELCVLELARVGDGNIGHAPPRHPLGRSRWCSATPAMSSPENPEPPVVLVDHDAAAPADGTTIASRLSRTQTLEVDHLDTDALRLLFLDHHGRHAPTRDGHDRDLRAGAGTHALPFSNTYLSSDSAPMQWSLLAIQQGPMTSLPDTRTTGTSPSWGSIHNALSVERIRRPPTFIPGRCAKSPPALRMLPPSQYPRPRVRHLWPCSSEAVRHAHLPVAGSR